MITTFRVLNSVVVALVLVVAPAAAQTGDVPKLAIQGYDSVAYFTDGRATKGKPAFSHVWDDQTFQFASAAHRERFSANPEQYAPNFPGYCAAALSMGMLVRADPEQWLIIDGKLYLFGGARGRQMAVERPGLVKESKAHWERLRKAPKDATQ